MPNDNRHISKELAAAALAAGKSIVDAAADAAVWPSTIQRWLKREDFCTQVAILRETTPVAPPEDWAGEFLDLLALTGNITKACDLMHLSRRTYYRRLESDPSFVQFAKDAIEDYGDRVDAEMHRRGIEGLDEPIVWQGRIMGQWIDAAGAVVAEGTSGAVFQPVTVKKYSDSVLLALARAKKPQEYKDHVRMEQVGDGGGPVKHQHEHSHTLTAEQFAALSAEEQQRVMREHHANWLGDRRSK